MTIKHVFITQPYNKTMEHATKKNNDKSTKISVSNRNIGLWIILHDYA